METLMWLITWITRNADYDEQENTATHAFGRNP